ncbi:MAG TPA: glycosyltransferase family A protein [Acidimicrobiales bacterium]|nr:glycosyltransferase family A protein [Acidimicrobiales bacterium]
MSVVIPLYNGSPLVAETVSSVLRQTFEDLELIVVDDGSTDGSADTVESQIGGDRRARLVRCANGGVAAARNRGLAQSEGRFVAFVDQDDLWYPDKLRRQVELMDRRPDLAVVGCLMDYVSATGCRLGRTAQTPLRIDADAVRTAVLMPFPISGALFRAGVLRRAGGSRDLFGPGMATAADMELVAIAAAAGDVDCIREALGGYRVHRSSVTAQSHRVQLTALHYLQAVLADPPLAERTPWTAYRDAYRPKVRTRLSSVASEQYRRAGIEALERRWPAALAHFGAAMALGPVYAGRRLLRQLGRI